MADRVHSRFLLPDRSYQAIVRSEIRKIAESAGFTGHRMGEVEILIAEITSNLVKHAEKGGELLVRVLAPEIGLEIISIDEGPGIRFPAKMMHDGKSTTQTLGLGLGTIRRITNQMDLYSQLGWGTVLFTRIYQDKELPKNSKNRFSAEGLLVCKPGETVCGDAWRCIQSGKKIRLASIDGLGHGMLAHEAAGYAYKMFGITPKLTPVDQIRQLHEQLRKTRGAVITIVHLDLLNNQVHYSGVGNIGMKIVSPTTIRGCFSYNGIVGHIMPGVLNNHHVAYNEKTDVIIMYSDGINGRWDLSRYPGILQHHSMILCAALYKDHKRGNDDATVVVARSIK